MKQPSNDYLQVIQTQQIDHPLSGFAEVLAIAMILWAVVYFVMVWYFLHRLKIEQNALWVESGKPSLLKNNLGLFRLVFGKPASSLNQNLKRYARIIRYLSYLGIILAIIFAVIVFRIMQSS